ncbi:MAG: hypothetical protein JWM32_1002 [Verrucomicrobia bacterium]|nr:hypothetical protein [Verrucomicrobiota bacterium]
MKTTGRIVVGCLLGALAMPARSSEDFIDRLDESLSVSALGGAFRGRLSGSLDLEGYFFSQPPPGLMVASGPELFAPRLSMFLDVQLGEKIYAFVQARVDRGFDPTDGGMEGRFDEYALRLTPWQDGRFNFQVGKFATVVGSWVHRHGSWDNPFVTAPLPYENLTGMWDVAAVRNGSTLLRWAHVQPKHFPGDAFADSRFRLPIIWGPSYATGAAISGEVGKFTYAGEIKNGALASRPEYWGSDEVRWDHPTYSARVGFRPDERWTMGFSASAGSYLLPSAAPTIAPGTSLDDYREVVLAQDVGFAWHHWQLWAEAFETRFEIPTVGDVRTTAYYVEAKYKFTPQFSGAVRWNEQVFGTVSDSVGGRLPWGYDRWRIDVAPSFRFTPHVQVKLQYSVQPDDLGAHDYQHTLAVQFTVRF